jgi:hypothetical protein
MKSINNDTSTILQLNLEECEIDQRLEDISPIGKDNKIFRMNSRFEKDNEKQIIQLISPTNDDKLPFEFSRNNFPMKNFVEKQTENFGFNEDKGNGLFENSSGDRYIDQNDNNFNGNTMMNNNNNGFYNNNNSNSNNNNNNMYGNQYFNQQNQFDNNQVFSMNKNNYPQENKNITNSQMNNNNKFGQNNINNNNNNNEYNHQLFLNEYNVNNNNSNSKQQQQQNQSDAKRKKQFVEREGDWVCMRCKNKNFSFRIHCNRCKIPKRESEELYSQHMKNLMNLVQMNEMMQNRVFNQNNPNFSTNNQNIPHFDSTLFSPNSCPIYDQNGSDMYFDKKNFTLKNNQNFQN